MEKINQNNRKVLLASSRGSGDPAISMYWDRIDKALFVIDEDGEYHRVYPSFLEGLPTVAAQLQKQKEGYVVSEIPVSNSMVAEFIDLKTIKLTFKNKVYSSTINSETVEVYPLPDGCIVSGRLTNGGSKYTTGTVNLSNGSGKDAIANVVASTTVPSIIEIVNSGSGYVDDTDVLVTGGSGANLSVDITTSDGRIERVSISQPGSGYVLREELTISGGSGDATIAITDVSGGDISEVTIYDGGYKYRVDDVLTLDGGDTMATFTVEEVSTTSNIVGEPKTQVEKELAVAKIKIDSVEYSEEKTDTVYLILAEDVDYSTYYGIIVNDVYNLAKETSTVTSMALTIDQPRSCSVIQYIYMDAYGSGPVKIYPKEISTYLKEVDSLNFIYWQKGISWDSFLSTFSEKYILSNPEYPELLIKSEIVIPDSVKKPDTIYGYYPLVGKKYLLNETSWIVGIIGSELDYDSSYYYVLYTFEQIGDTIQLTPAGSSSAKCGVSDWGGEWGADILEFRIDRI